MRKEIKYIVPYRKEGEDSEIEIKIDFVSNRVMKDFSALYVLGNKAEKAWDRVSDLNTILSAEESKGELSEEKIKEYSKEIEEQYVIIMEFTENGYFDKRLSILNRILIDNGYKDDKMLMSPDFWEECVDPGDFLNFLTKVVYKDTDKKKVAVAV